METIFSIIIGIVVIGLMITVFILKRQKKNKSENGGNGGYNGDNDQNTDDNVIMNKSN